MWSFGSFCDEFYVNTRLYLKLDLDPSRETLLHFLEVVRRASPRMTRLRRRDDGGLVLDEDERGSGSRNFVRLDPSALKFGVHNPPDVDAVSSFAELVLKNAPHHLSLSILDYDYIEVVYGFDLEFRGNHDELVADALFADHPLLNVLISEDERVIDCQPFLGVTLSEDCEKQAYLEIKGRTSTYEVRSGEFEPTPLSVYLNIRRYWSGKTLGELEHVHRDLLMIGEKIAVERVVPQVVQPLAAAIASRR
jgi:hypothetical protein